MTDETDETPDAQWRDLLAATPLFRAYPREALDHIDAREKRLPAGLTLFEEGEAATEFYVVLEGELEAIVGPQEQPHRFVGYNTGKLIGVLSYFMKTPRSYTAVALSDTRLMRLSDLDEVWSGYPEHADHVVRVLRMWMRRHQVASCLRHLLGPEAGSCYLALHEALEWRSIDAGEHLLQVGQVVDGLVIVVAGALELIDPTRDPDVDIVAVVERGEQVGALETLAESESVYNVRAAIDTQYLWIEGAALRRLALERPQVGQLLLRDVTQRLRSVTGRWARANKRIAILPAGDPMGPSDFTPRFVEALQGIGGDGTRDGEIKVVSRQLIDDAVDGHALARELTGRHRERFISLWLAARKQWYTTMIYQVEHDLEWATYCVRQADEVLWVADASGDPALSDIERKLRDRLDGNSGTHRRRCAHRLVLQQAGTDAPTQTSRWLERRRWLCMHHHVRHRNARDVERVARFATGRAVGMVLSGGGARGFAHVGVIEALMDAGQPIDCLAGVSMGAVVASMIGQDWTPDTTMTHAKKLADRFLDRTLPLVALGSARRFNRALREVYGDTELEDLMLPTIFLAANLTDADETYLESGRLREAVRASNAPAGLSPPVVTADGDLLSDGFIINNLPVDLLRRRFGCDRVIAVDVMPSRKLPPVQNYGGRGLSGFTVLWRRMNPFVRTLDMPGIQVILTRALELAGLRHQRAAKARADRYLSPPVEQYGTFEYEAGDRIRRIGKRYAANPVTSGGRENALAATKGVLSE